MTPELRKAKRNLEESLKRAYFPRCYDSKKEYEEWLDAEAIINTKDFRRNVCEDCSKCYQNQMIEKNRCVNPQLTVED